MGAYLSTPNTKKSSLDISDNKRYACAVSSMQGWRMNMEDAFTCSPDLEENTGLFAVYDGHGGADVAIYCACHFADMLREKEEYKNGNYEEALRKTFMDIDKILLDPKTASELKFLSKRDPSDPPPTEEDLKQHQQEENEANEEAKLLCEEATMDIVDVLKRYGAALNADEEEEHIPAKDESSGSAQKTSQKKNDEEKSSTNSETSSDKGSSKQSEEKKTEQASSAATDDKPEVNGKRDSLPEEKDEATSTAAATEPEKEKSADETSSSSSTTTEKKPPMKFKKVKLKPQKKQPVEDESDDEDYTGFESDEAIEGSDDDDSELDSDEIDSDDDEDIIIESNDGEVNEDEVGSMTDIPGCDSGTTAVVALLHDKDLYVANAGDSRCVICRKDGTTEDMSFDHKPEDEKELQRITKAGGRVNAQGRVNGGLNLSRAIGDHFYKKNKDFSLEEQMITALPDIKKISLQPDDEFMVLACDGIWNVMTSEEVVKFVRDRLNGTVEIGATKKQQDGEEEENGANGDEKDSNGDSNGACGDENGDKKADKQQQQQDKLSKICEELFDQCMAPDTMGDGTGCDNMTCILIQFNKEWLQQSSNGTNNDNIQAMKMKQVTSCNGDSPVVSSKRPRQQDAEESESKRTKAAVQV